MREFSLLDVIKYYIRKIWIVVVTSFFAFLMGYFYVNEYFTPMYEESATIILGKSKGDKTESEMSYSTITLYDSLVNNYLQLDNYLFRIVKVTSDNKILLILNEMASTSSSYYDDRYNQDRRFNSGFNDYRISRMSEYLDDLYNNI